MVLSDDNVRNALIELNLLGSAIFPNDPYHNFLEPYQENILNPDQNFEINDSVDFNRLENLLKGNIIPLLKGKTPVVFLSGGIDSTVLADTLYCNNIQFEACSYFMSEDDPAIPYVEYLETRYGIKSHRIYLDYDRLKQIYTSYFDTYQSLNLDYAFLSMCHMVEEVTEKLSKNGPLIFLDGIEGDNLFGYRNDLKLKIRSHLLRAGSQILPNTKIFNSRKLNIYSSSLINNYALTSIYQNFIFVKLLQSNQVKSISKILENYTIDTSGHSFHVQNMLGMLYYMGKRVGYKSFGPIRKSGHDVIYPFTSSDILSFGFELKNKRKIKPVIKAPLKYYLEKKGYSNDFVFSPKRGMGFDLFKVIEFDMVQEGVGEIAGYLNLKQQDKCNNYLNRLFKNRDLAVDHFMFGLALGGKFIKEQVG